MATHHSVGKRHSVSTTSVHLTSQACLLFFGLGFLTLWRAISQATLLLEIGWMLLGADPLGLGICPLSNRLVRWYIPHGVTFFVVICLTLLTSLFLMGSLVVPDVFFVVPVAGIIIAVIHEVQFHIFPVTEVLGI